ncbi:MULTISPECIES: class I SAM-dependent methyltransferase [Cohnella]|uniref:Methyltransferase family protein n=1 Tax=Cohnella phaseoli TaxID=456490 RepID=A0A3D9I104_9BACL|nr:class I SAM-dependent methyltransferase [Cohnella phaseoli]RED55423.1 methyltransferase family protein [Cohnella phaseoli]
MSALYPIYVNYPINPRPRFGGNRPTHGPLHAIIAGNRSRYEAELWAFARYAGHLDSIAYEHDDAAPAQPSWNNDWFSGLDALALYGIVAERRPKRYCEIGSGNSTMFAKRAAADHGLTTEIVSIDPFPREEIDEICSRIVRKPLEETDLSLFEELEAGDILFVDSSHYVFQNSDANIVFLEVMPRLKSGVLVHFHDIFLPDDYPESWSRRYYNEQYMLAAYLLAQNPQEPAYEVAFPSHYVSQDAELAGLAQTVLGAIGPQGVPARGGSFWLTKR